MERPEPISVSELNAYMKTLVDEDAFLNNVYIRGEISNFKRHYTGHLYFTLKDKNSLIKCVMFKSYTSYLNFEPQDGVSVVILGTVSVFERDGVYQIYAKGMEVDGVGALYEAFEKLKTKLGEEGLFDEKHKKKIPMLPKAIGVITSKTGAVIRDIINVTTRRFPGVHIILYPASVQGKGAAETIVKGIEYFNQAQNVDVLIIGRGGGSLEDLWPFNEEITARAIFASQIPIISAVGHETDFTISDFVADLRAPTPSAAGELAVPELSELTWKISNYQRSLAQFLKKKLELMKHSYEAILSRRILKNPLELIHDKALLVERDEKDLIHYMSLRVKEERVRLTRQIASLDSLSPLKTLSRGYSVVIDKNDNVIVSIKTIKKDDDIKIVMHDGSIEAKVVS